MADETGEVLVEYILVTDKGLVIFLFLINLRYAEKQEIHQKTTQEKVQQHIQTEMSILEILKME